MFNLINWLQYFDDVGAEASGVDSSVLSEQTSGVTEPAVSEQEDVTMGDRLKELGVPEAYTKRAKYKEVIGRRTQQPAAEQKEDAQPSGMTWDEFMSIPENKERMSKTITDRLSKLKGENERLQKLAPSIQLVARQYGMDIQDLKDLDVDAFNAAVTEDSKLYEQKAAELGVDPETAMRIDRLETEKRMRDRQDEIRTQEEQTRAHLMKLDQQANELRQILPGFDLAREIQTNPGFVRLTTPDLINSGFMTVKDAYIQTHPEMRSAINQTIAQKTLQQASNAIQSGSMRPQENGSNGQGGSVGEIKYSQMSREQRRNFKKNLEDQWAQGRTVYAK